MKWLFRIGWWLITPLSKRDAPVHNIQPHLKKSLGSHITKNLSFEKDSRYNFIFEKLWFNDIPWPKNFLRVHWFIHNITTE